MNFLKTLGSLVGSNAATGGLPYVVNSVPGDTAGGGGDGSGAVAVVDSDAYALPDFQLSAGHSRADVNQAVSIFKSRQPASQPTLNALKRIKTLRHPNILAYVDGVEVPNNGPVIIITEPVVPLAQYLDELRLQYGGTQSEEFQTSVSWGLRSVLLALRFINMDCKLLHGRLTPQSIFVTKGGDWKLGGFELTGELTSDGPSTLFTSFEQYSDANYKSPECQRRDWRSIGQSPPYAVDIWAFAAVLFFVFNDCQIRATELSSAANVPHALRMQYRKAVESDARRRSSPDKFLAASYFDTTFIKRMDFLDNLAVKTPEEKVEFYKDLSANLSSLPQAFGVHKVLPALKAVVEFGAATGTKNGPVKLDPSASHMLPIMVQIGSSLAAEDFKEQVLPVIVKLFSCHDRAVRVQLLQMMEKFAVHFDAKLVNSPVIFDNICSGFTDGAPVLRELTVKSMLHIADKLSDSNLNTRVMKYFAKLQTDPEPAIRTNTTICLGRIAPKLNEATRPKVLFPAFSRAMRDPFPHARLAGLKSLTACEDLFSPQGVAGNVVPAIAPLLLDVSISVREQASISIDLFMKKIMEEAGEMKIREAEHAKLQQAKREAGETVDEQGPEEVHNVTSVATSSAGYAASLTSWAASAVVSNVGKMVGSGAASTPPTPASTQTPASTTITPSSRTLSFGTTPVTASSSSLSELAAADDFGADDDAWGGDDDLDGLGSPKPTMHSSSFASSTHSTTHTSSMKLNVSRPGPGSAPTSNSSSSSSLFAMTNKDAGWGDDNWGDSDGLTANPSSGSSLSTSATSSLKLGSASGATMSSFMKPSVAGSSLSLSPSSVSSSASRTGRSSGLNVSVAVSARKTASERLAEAKAKREAASAVKLTPAKKNDEWDNWDF